MPCQVDNSFMKSRKEICTFKELHVVQRDESWFPGSLKVARDVASEEDGAQVTEKLPFHAGNNAKYLKDFQQKATETDQQNHFVCCAMMGQIEERQTGRKKEW